jgi:hypothetical protein
MEKWEETKDGVERRRKNAILDLLAFENPPSLKKVSVPRFG